MMSELKKQSAEDSYAIADCIYMIEQIIATDMNKEGDVDGLI